MPMGKRLIAAAIAGTCGTALLMAAENLSPRDAARLQTKIASIAKNGEKGVPVGARTQVTEV